MNKTVETNELEIDKSDDKLNLSKLTHEQIQIIAVICSLLTFILILLLYKFIKCLRRKRDQSKQKLKKFNNIVLVNNNLSKPDLKPISQQFQINTAYSSQSNFNRLFPYYNVYSNFKNSTGSLSPVFSYNDDVNNNDQKNPSFNLENNLFLSKKFIHLKKTADDQKQTTTSSSTDSANNEDKKSTNNSIVSTNQNISTDSSDHRSEESDTDGQLILSKKSQRLSVARPVSIKFNLLYSSKDKTLYIEILSVDNLIFNSKHCYFYVKINLRDNARELRFKSQKSKITKGSTSVFFNETKQYIINQFDKLNDCTIQLSVYNRIRSLSRKSLVGDLLVDLSRPDLVPNVKLMFDEHLTPICIVSNKKLGKLFRVSFELNWN